MKLRADDTRIYGDPAAEHARLSRKVAQACTAARTLMYLGLAVISAPVTIGFFLVGEITLEQTTAALIGTALASILTGASAYGTGVNIELNAERAAYDLDGHSDDEGLAT